MPPSVMFAPPVVITEEAASVTGFVAIAIAAALVVILPPTLNDAPVVVKPVRAAFDPTLPPKKSCPVPAAEESANAPSIVLVNVTPSPLTVAVLAVKITGPVTATVDPPEITLQLPSKICAF